MLKSPIAHLTYMYACMHSFTPKSYAIVREPNDLPVLGFIQTENDFPHSSPISSFLLCSYFS